MPFGAVKSRSFEYRVFEKYPLAKGVAALQEQVRFQRRNAEDAGQQPAVDVVSFDIAGQHRKGGRGAVYFIASNHTS
jgi:hypothetical protein